MGGGPKAKTHKILNYQSEALYIYIHIYNICFRVGETLLEIH